MELKRYNSIGFEEQQAVSEVMRSGILSGFIAGPPESRDVGPNGGPKVQALEQAWAKRYGVKHALSFNSATSALLAACGAIRLDPGDHVICPPWTMSATVAASKFYGAVIDFADVEAETFCIDPEQVHLVIDRNWRTFQPKAIIAVNLFGHPARLKTLKQIAEEMGAYFIEDSAQTPLATENGKIVGTVGDIGIYSLNRHKHINCGEGGIAVTDDDELAAGMRSVRNHGIEPLGLNLRMTELEAAIAEIQLRHIDEHVEHARRIGRALSEGLADIMEVPVIRDGCEHDFYLWTAKGKFPDTVPHIKNYIQPLHRIFTGGQTDCPVVERLRDTEDIACFECTKYEVDPDELIEAIRADR